MASAGLGSVARQVERLFGGGTVCGLDEAALLRRFVLSHDPAALDALVTRHGPMVLGVCRRVLGNSHDAEDAFQAVFLVLVKKAKSIRDPRLLGPWLHGVAHRVAVRARANAAIRHRRESPGAEDLAMAADGGLGGEAEGLDRSELRAVLDDEIARLPERFRRVVVLCYLDGLTHEEAAERLLCPVGTVKSRLGTGRAKLRERLARRGVGAALSATAFSAALASETARAAVPPALAESTLKAGLLYASTGTIAGTVAGASTGGTVSPHAASLADGVISTMFLTKLKVLGSVVLIGALTTGAAGMASLQIAGAGAGQDRAAQDDKPLDDALAKVKAEAEAAARRSEEKARALAEKLGDLQAEVERLRAENQELKAGGANASRSMRSAMQRGGATARAGDAQTAAGPSGASNATTDVFSGAGAPGMPMGREGAADRNFNRQGTGATVARGGPGQDGVAMSMPGGPGMGQMGMMGYGGMGGMAGMMPTRSSIASISSANYIIVQKPQSGRVSAYSALTDAWSSYSIPEGMKATAIGGDSLVALYVKGDKIGQVATYLPKPGKWYPIDLKAPASDQAIPLVGSEEAVYAIGRHVYAFSAQARRWDVLELEDGAKPVPMLMTNRVTVEHKDHLYIFGAKSGKWTDFDASTGEVVGGNEAK